MKMLHRLLFVSGLLFLAGGLRAQEDPALPPERPEPFRSLRTAIEPFLESLGKPAPIRLEVRYAWNRIGRDWVYLRSYNGGLVGPTIRVRPGDTLRITLDNRLGPNPPGQEHVHDTPMVPGGFNTTNLHTHGLHVSPEGNSDNVLLEVKPGRTVQYEIMIPDDHPAGTFWYHPHWHGATSMQVASGMSGALIVEGGLDEVPEIKAAKEEILLFQQIPYDENGHVEEFSKAFGGGAWERSKRFTTINGVKQPRITMRPGEVHRWRMIHSGVRETILLGVVKDYQQKEPDAGWLFEIALDGLATGSLDERSSIELQPGYRSDALVKAPAQPGRYYLIDGQTSPDESLLREEESRKVLAVIDVEGSPMDMKLPRKEQLAGYKPYKSIEDHEISGFQTAEFNLIEFNGGVRYLINGRDFDPDRPRVLTLGRVEEWTLTSKRGSHPFHIHVNPFEVIRKEKDGTVTRFFRDTYLVRGPDPSTGFPGDTLKVRMRYEDFVGRFVLHCHILDHEDRGMMELIEIRP